MISTAHITIGPNLALFTGNSVNSGKFEDRHPAFYEAISLPSQLQVFGVFPEYTAKRWPEKSSLIPSFLSTPLKNGKTMHDLLAIHDNTMDSIIDLGTSDIEVTIRIHDKTSTLLCSIRIAISLYDASIKTIQEI